VNVQLAANREACRPFLERALPFDVDGAGATVEDYCDGAAVFELLDGDRRVGAFSLEVREYSDGRCVRVLAAGGEPGYDHCGAMLSFVERQAREHIHATSMGCETRRRGLVKRLQAEGFELAGYILRKKV